MRMLSMIAMMTVLTGCWSNGSTSQGTARTTTNAAGVKSMELTAPWKDMNLSIEGGGVVSSTSDNLTVRFPATPADAAGGLFHTVKGELVAAGWSLEGEEHLGGAHDGLLTTAEGNEAVLGVTLNNDRPVLTIDITG